MASGYTRGNPDAKYPRGKIDLANIARPGFLPALGNNIANTLGGMLGGMRDAVQAPGVALSGGYDQYFDPATGQTTWGTAANPEAMLGNASNLAGMVMLGASPIPKPSNSLGIFGGEMAKTADKAALEVAKSMAEKGVAREDIWNQTGWFKGVDGKWRFEIPDSGSLYRDWKVPQRDPFAKNKMVAEYLKNQGIDVPISQLGNFPPGALDAVPKPTLDNAWLHAYSSLRPDNAPTAPLSAVMDHQGLLDAYPELADLPVGSEVADGYAGTSWRGNDQNRIAIGYGPGIDQRSTALHELQHQVQHIEEFARGANKSSSQDALHDGQNALNALSWRRDLEMTKLENPKLSHAEAEAALIKEYQSVGLSVPTAFVQRMANDVHMYPNDTLAAMARPVEDLVISGAIDKGFSQSAKDQAYKRYAGEVESRAVQARRNMTPEERKATPPWASWDVPESKQIIRM